MRLYEQSICAHVYTVCVVTTVKMVVEICHQFWWIFLGPNKPPTLVVIIHHTGMVAYYHHIWWFHVMLKNETLYMFFLYNMTLLPMADVYSMMHCHFMSTCGILCLCTLFVFFHAFPSFPSVSPPPSLPVLSMHSLTFSYFPPPCAYLVGVGVLVWMYMHVCGSIMCACVHNSCVTHWSGMR